MRILLILLVLAATCLAGDDIEARLTALEKRLDALDARLARIEKLLEKAFKTEKPGNYEAAKVKDMKSMSYLVGMLVIERRVPMKDGQVDVFWLVRKGKIGEESFWLFKSARFSYGPTNEQIKAGDHSKFPYERFRGDIPKDKQVPLLWDKKPDKQGGRVLGFSGGSVKWVPEERALAYLRAAGQLPQKPAK